ncbi:MAG: excinuclease ABC subunit UvrA [Gammaproteobacteria bacterium]|nr:excinuclease ABC subunit UvrA [Gammaproteobacteria bacterium]
MTETIHIQGARTHNLKNISLKIPRDQLVVITGLSGSGKSSLAFDTLYAEGQRRYVESLSAYARQFLSMMAKPDVDQIDGLSPAISIEQKSTSHNPRSTVGTITEIYDYMRLLFARVGQPRCPKHDTVLEAQTISQMVDTVLALPNGTKVMLLAPIVRQRKGEYQKLFDDLRSQGFVRVRIDGENYDIDDTPNLSLKKKHTIEVIIDRFKVRQELRLRLAESFETAITLTDGLATVAMIEPQTDDHPQELLFSARFSCSRCNYNMPELEPRLFSFNNPMGACPDCDGLGVKQVFAEERVIHNAELSIGGGAVCGWDRRHSYYYPLLEALANHYGFSLDKSYRSLPKRIKQIILYGSGDEIITFDHIDYRGQPKRTQRPFEGVIPNMERRYRETSSQAARDHLAKYLLLKPCCSCTGSRLREEARHVFVGDRSIADLTKMSTEAARAFFKQLTLEGWRKEVANRILKEINNRLGFLVEVGLDYLTIDRSADTLSGGEAQRIRLASQIGSGLVGVMYILDEPSIGLHQRDNNRLLKTLLHLRDLGNTVLVVEHDEDAIRQADHIIDVGPGAGSHGGKIIAQGKLNDIINSKRSLTGQYLSGKQQIDVPTQRSPVNRERILSLKGACCNNLQAIDVDIPVGLFTCITGVSGSGKSSLINDTLYPLAATKLNGATLLQAGKYDRVEGLSLFDKCVEINQSPIGRTPRSNPATYTGLFTPIRELFAATRESRSRGYLPGRFSFNVKGGRCEACEGDGVIKVEMHFLADVYVTCDLCQSKRYNRETLEITYKGKNIHQILEMTVEEALAFFDAVPVLKRKLETLMDVGLSYIKLGQSATTLSGGEAQRVKLSRELSKRSTGKTLYMLDEPTTGLHFHDISHLLQVLLRLRDQGNTIIVIEHNLDVIKTADWIIDLGPEGGHKGGKIIASGTPEQVAKKRGSYTGRFLKPLLAKN